ncbi:BLUF domain-containing protein [Roseibium sp.]|uniref:BLUF domain-containing protein n=1 Tax=Roseibium sp. TaxID=1936156 RepID=UPI003B526810
MHLVSMIYASKTKDIDDVAIDGILQKARSNNPKLGLTGVLLFNSKFFVQCLEGGRMDVNRLYNAIAKDPRHEDPVILDYREVPSRSFSEWSMAYIGESEYHEPMAFKYTTKKSFNPYDMNGDRIRAFLNEMVQVANPASG